VLFHFQKRLKRSWAKKDGKFNESGDLFSIAHGIYFSSDEFDSIFQCSAKRFPIPERPH
jgi:hypothetical protein